MTRLISIIFTLFIAASHASAQDAAYQYTSPVGWTKQIADNLVLFAPPGDKTGSTALVLSFVLPAGPNIDQQFTGMRSVLETSLGMRKVQDGEEQREKSNGGETIVFSGAYDMNSGRVVAVFFARREKGAFGMGVLMTANLAEAENYGNQVNNMVSTLRLADQAPQLAASNLAKLLQQAVPAQGNAQAPQQPAAAAKPQISEAERRSRRNLAESISRVMNSPVYTGIGPGGMSVRVY